MSLALSTCVSLISLIQLINGAQFLNAAALSLSSVYLAATSAPAPVIVIVLIYASL